MALSIDSLRRVPLLLALSLVLVLGCQTESMGAEDAADTVDASEDSQGETDGVDTATLSDAEDDDTTLIETVDETEEVEAETSVELPPLGELSDLDLGETIVFPGAGRQYALMLYDVGAGVEHTVEYEIVDGAGAEEALQAPGLAPVGQGHQLHGHDLGMPQGYADTHIGSCFRPALSEFLPKLKARNYRAPRPGDEPPVPEEVPAVGDPKMFKVAGEDVLAEAVIVSEELIVYLDRTNVNPEGELDPADEKFAEIVRDMEAIVLPRLRLYFGEESDINGDGHIAILFSPLVPEQGATAYVSPLDITPLEALEGMALQSNQQELIYVTPPNMQGGPMGSARATLEVMAHEFNHLIYYYRKYVLNDASVWAQENPYITEGFSALAQDLSGFQMGNLFMVAYAMAPVEWSLNDISENMSGYIYDRDGSLRVLGALLCRYLFDRAGGDNMDDEGTPLPGPGMDWLHGWFNAPELGQENMLLQAPDFPDFEALVRGFYATLLLDGRTQADNDEPLNDDPLLAYLPVTEDPVTGRIRGMSMDLTFGPIVISGPELTPIEYASGVLRGGGVEYLIIDVPADQDSVSIRIQSETIDELRAASVCLREAKP